MISFINKMDHNLFQQLQNCLNTSPSGPSPPSPTGCKSNTIQSGDTCWSVADAQCGDGNDWSTELFQDSSCTTPMTDSSCGAIQVGQAVYSNCNVAPTNCKAYTVASGNTCWQIGQDQCKDGNAWGTELFQDPSCTTPMTDSSCGAMQIGQTIYTNCN